MTKLMKLATRPADLPREQFQRYQELVAELTAPLLKFASVAFASEASAAMRRPYGKTEWLELTSIERTRRIKAHGRKRAEAALARELAPEPAPVRRAPSSRYVVACADACGEMVPARGPRPVLAFMRGHAPAKRRATRPK
ncbi:hypothetical protein [Leifsonia sp. NPDC058248]|uniref:hypothetical protein n=1 Tax=Leifsonia sp. NPDC058248 TaxID=3346402 RepID=UPI0036DEACD7